LLDLRYLIAQTHYTEQFKSVRSWLPSYLLLALIWGFSFYLMMIGLQAFTPVGVAFSRIGFGAITLVILSLATKTPLPPRWAWKYLFVLSLLFVSIPWMLFAYGETRISSALAGIFNGATPLMTLVAILLVFPEEKPTRQRILGLVVGFIGILVVIGIWDTGDAENGAGIDFIGVGAIMLAISCYGFAFPYARRYLTGPTVREPLAPISLATGMMLCGLVVTGPIVAVTGITDAEMSASPLLAMVALGVLGSGLAYALSFQVSIKADATTASTVTYITPLIAVVVGAVLLNEQITWNQPVGGLLVVIGAATAQGLLGRKTTTH
jgi:drug/metabolite transporter (DMT)-like permease